MTAKVRRRCGHMEDVRLESWPRTPARKDEMDRESEELCSGCQRAEMMVTAAMQHGREIAEGKHGA